jgi:hypothetical protein
MTFSSFFTRLLGLLVLLVGLVFAVYTERFGVENVLVFTIGFLAAGTLIQWHGEDTRSVFPIPAGWLARTGVVILLLIRLQLLITLVENGHFFVGTLVALVTLFSWSAFTDVLKEEREIKKFAVRMSNAEAAASASPFVRTDDNVATLAKLSEPDNRVGFKQTYGGTSLGQP